MAFTPAEAGPAHVAVVVDVMRATSTITQALASGYRRVLCCREIDEARALRAELGDQAVVGGERNAVLIEGFDLGASPRDYLEPRAETAILTTTNGTRTILAAASSAEHVLLGSLLNLEAVAAKAQVPNENVTVVCAGFEGRFAIDDAYCAGRIVSLLLGPRLLDGVGRSERAHLRPARPRGRPALVHTGEHARGGAPLLAHGRSGGRDRGLTLFSLQ